MANLPWDIRIADTIGKAVPNEFSKLSPWFKYIPYLNVIGAILGGVDAGTTTASDVYQKNRESGMSGKESRANAAFPVATQAWAGTGYGGGTDPGIYGSPGDNSKDWADYVGMVGNLYGNAASFGNAYQNNNIGGMLGSGYGAYGNISGLFGGNNQEYSMGANNGTQGTLINSNMIAEVLKMIAKYEKEKKSKQRIIT